MHHKMLEIYPDSAATGARLCNSAGDKFEKLEPPAECGEDLATMTILMGYQEMAITV